MNAPSATPWVLAGLAAVALGVVFDAAPAIGAPLVGVVALGMLINWKAEGNAL